MLRERGTRRRKQWWSKKTWWETCKRCKRKEKISQGFFNRTKKKVRKRRIHRGWRKKSTKSRRSWNQQLYELIRKSNLNEEELLFLKVEIEKKEGNPWLMNKKSENFKVFWMKKQSKLKAKLEKDWMPKERKAWLTKRRQGIWKGSLRKKFTSFTNSQGENQKKEFNF